MDTPPLIDEEEVFAVAAALPAAERPAYLQAACAGRPEMRRRIEQLLRAHDASGFMEADAATVPDADIEEQLARLRPEEAGERIGPYKLLQQIGAGGFGTVWMAEQLEPVRRRVALKIIKLGMDTKEVIARFEQERQALAVMDHPNIAKVFDAGRTPAGRPFFVMELVRGIKITEYCDQANLSTADRLRLFIAVCHAVQHAHQKGIIHRDLKPSNILVTLHDGEPVPKVIDFGVAKAMQSGSLTELTLFTRFEQMIGTPLYMSPEQAEMTALDIDTRSDLYSLGVLLYELLTGRTPIEQETLQRVGLDEVRRVIREVDPPRPSTRVKALDVKERTTTAKRRQVDPDRLALLLRGDLDWIVMKCLEKDRRRRYETANGLAQDLRRHLNNEAITARPPTTGYLVSRLIKRNKVAFGAGAAVAAALVVGLSVAVRSWVKERRARVDEATQRGIADERTKQAHASAAQASASAAQATASELKARRFLYAADMNLAQQALRTLRMNNVGRARLLLDRHRPAPGGLDLRGWEWRYLWQQCRSGAAAKLSERENRTPYSLSFSPDGAWLAAGSSDGHLEVWDVTKRQLAKVLHKQGTALVAFSPQGDLFVTEKRRVIKRWNFNTGEETVLRDMGVSIRSMSFSHDGEWLAVLTMAPQTACVLNAIDGSPVMTCQLSSSTYSATNFNHARLSPDKRRLYVSFGDGNQETSTLRCMSVPDARTIWEVPIWEMDANEIKRGRDLGVTAMALSPDGSNLVVATGFSDETFRVLDAKTGEVLRKLQGHTNYIFAAAFPKEGRMLATASVDQTIQLWDTAKWTQLTDPLRGHAHEIWSVAVSDDARFVASGSKDGELLLWDTRATRPAIGRRDLPSHVEDVIALPGGESVVARSANGQWSLIDLLTLEEEALPPEEMLSVAPGAASTASPGVPRLVPESRRRQRDPPIDKQRITLPQSWSAPAFSPDGKFFAIASAQGPVGLYDRATYAEIERIHFNMLAMYGVAFSPDSQRLVGTSDGATAVSLWDVTTRQPLLILSSPGRMLSAVEFTDDGNTLLVGRHAAGTWQFWRAPSWEEIAEAERDGGPWRPTERVQPPRPAPKLGEVTQALERTYRKKLNLGNLADFLHLQGRSAEAEPLFRELLKFCRAHPVGDDAARHLVIGHLTNVLSFLAQTAPTLGEPEKVTDRVREVNVIESELLVLVAKSAPKNRQTAESRINIILSELRSSLRQIGRQDLLNDVSKEAENCFKNLPPHLQTPGILQRLFSIFEHRTKLLIDDGKLPEARAAYAEACVIRERLLRSEPSNADRQRDLAVAYNQLGDLAEADGDRNAARRAYEAALETSERLVQSHPNKAEWQQSLWAAYSRLGNLARTQGDRKAARAAYEKGLAISQRLARSDPSLWKGRLSDNYTQLAFLALAEGDRKAGRATFEKELEISAKRSPNNPYAQQELASTYSRLSVPAKLEGDLKTARALCEKAVEIQEGVAQAQPTIHQFQQNYTNLYNQLSELAKIEGDLKAARAACEKAVTIGERLTRSGVLTPVEDSLLERLRSMTPKARWQRDLAVSYHRLGEIKKAAGDLKAARDACAKGHAVSERLAQGDPGNTDLQESLSTSYTKLASLATAEGDLKAARASCEKALSIRRRLAHSDPGNFDWQQNLAISYHQAAELAQAVGDLKAARLAAEKAMTIRECLAKSDPQHVDWQWELSTNYHLRGSLALAEGKLKAARTAAQMACDIRKRLAESALSNTDWQQHLSGSYLQLSEVAQAEGDLIAARAACDKALEMRKSLAGRDSSNADWQQNLASSYHQLGDLTKRENALEAAGPACKEAFAIRKRLAQSDPQNADWQQKLASSYHQVGELAEAEQDLTDARAAYAKARELGRKMVDAMAEAPAVCGILGGACLKEAEVLVKMEPSTLKTTLRAMLEEGRAPLLQLNEAGKLPPAEQRQLAALESALKKLE